MILDLGMKISIYITIIIDNMSKNSSKIMYTQLMEWLPTLKSKLKKPVRSNDITQQRRTSDYKVRIKNIG